MVGWRGTGRERGGAYAFVPQRPSAVSMLGWVGHRNGDRDCEPAELTEHQARDGGKLGRASPAYSSIIGNARCTASKTAWQITEGTAREIALSASQCAPGPQRPDDRHRRADARRQRAVS